MKAVVAASIMLATLLCFGQEKRKSPKPPDIVVVESAAHRSEGSVALEGRVRNGSAKRVNGLILQFDFIDSGGQVIATKQSAVDEDVLEPAAESAFHFETADPVRAVQFRVRATDTAGHDLRVEPAAPKAIE
jgi:hypothetical protein